MLEQVFMAFFIKLDKLVWELVTYSTTYFFKEVIQPQVPLGLPCYDFTPVMNHSVVTVLLNG